MYEGNFMESIAPNAFLRSFAEGGQKSLLEHGRDPQVGNRPLGPIETLREDSVGAFYEVTLLPGVPTQVIEALRHGLYGASFRFSVMREDVIDSPGVSATNANNLPERVIREARVFEFGPVVFPAYASATATIGAAA